MWAYCMNCWSLVPAKDLNCPVCGKGVTAASKSFDQKLLAALSHPRPETRARLCSLVGRRKMREAVPTLLRLLTEPDLYVRLAALEALGDIGDTGAVPTIELLARENSIPIRQAARRALDRIRTRSAVERPSPP